MPTWLMPKLRQRKLNLLGLDHITSNLYLLKIQTLEWWFLNSILNHLYCFSIKINKLLGENMVCFLFKLLTTYFNFVKKFLKWNSTNSFKDWIEWIFLTTKNWEHFFFLLFQWSSLPEINLKRLRNKVNSEILLIWNFKRKSQSVQHKVDSFKSKIIKQYEIHLVPIMMEQFMCYVISKNIDRME